MHFVINYEFAPDMRNEAQARFEAPPVFLDTD